MSETYTRHDWTSYEPRVAFCRRCALERVYVIAPASGYGGTGMTRERVFRERGAVSVAQVMRRCGAKKERKRG